MEEDNLYQVKVEFDDGILLVFYTNGPENFELDVLETVYERYYESQPDITKYIVTNLTKSNNIKALTDNFTHARLALKAFAYAEEYQ
jgi:hypothetical protein